MGQSFACRLVEVVGRERRDVAVGLDPPQLAANGNSAASARTRAGAAQAIRRRRAGARRCEVISSPRWQAVRLRPGACPALRGMQHRATQATRATGAFGAALARPAGA